jgi:hypothetical protein
MYLLKMLQNQRLNRGIASFSVMLGRRINISINQKKMAASHSDVAQKLRRTGRGGNGFTSWFDCGVGKPPPSFGGTGGLRMPVCSWRFRSPSLLRVGIDILF